MTGFGRRRSAIMAREKRRSDRSKVYAPAHIDTPASRQVVTVIDISPTGAQLMGSAPPPSRPDVCLNINGLIVYATIAWRKDNRFGVKFEESEVQLDPTTIRQAILDAEINGRNFDREAALRELANKPDDNDDAVAVPENQPEAPS